MSVRTGTEILWEFNAEETLTVERDTDSGFGTAVTIASGLSGPSQSLVDEVPIIGASYYYRAKVSRGGFADSSWSSTITVVPVVLT